MSYLSVNIEPILSKLVDYWTPLPSGVFNLGSPGTSEFGRRRHGTYITQKTKKLLLLFLIKKRVNILIFKYIFLLF